MIVGDGGKVLADLAVAPDKQRFDNVFIDCFEPKVLAQSSSWHVQFAAMCVRVLRIARIRIRADQFGY